MKRLAQRGTDINLESGPQMCEYEAITARIARDAPRSVLDWGCGWGQVSHLLKRAGLDVASFDYRPEAHGDGLRRLERFPDVEAYISATEPRKLPYDGGQFDAVLSCGVLEHVQDPDASLDELRRVLRPGGTLYVYKLPNRFSYLEWIARRLAGRGLYYHGRDPYDALYDVRSARELIARHGFAITELRRANMLPLTLDGRRFQEHADAIWKTNQALSRVPGLNLLATNVEVIARAPHAG
ncbi:MAG: class I SAM-dependent methyltransferase [Solirubrobacteraceae bacterium]